MDRDCFWLTDAQFAKIAPTRAASRASMIAA
jgi:hypothetical protein